MKIQKPLPGMTPEETERQLRYMNAVIMFKQMHSLPIFVSKLGGIFKTKRPFGVFFFYLQSRVRTCRHKAPPAKKEGCKKKERVI